MPGLTFPVGRPFRLHLRHQVLDGWVTDHGQALVLDADGYGLTWAATLPDLARGYGGGDITWPAQHHQQEGTQQLS